MGIDTVRLNITLPKELVVSVNRLAGPGKRSRFIREAIKQRIEKKEMEELERVLEEGYRATGAQSLAITKEFEVCDLEGWDEY
ncbi:MAG: hypothetical protein AVO38_13625 [delta proteobacterium ML8_D]|jgi:metal-responsive CopG/Arc/MetJ family transcriptional regulator|nr:MAG: hypothetical protein AVO34_10125 [Firmicutes bacterium ML8_F2]OPL13264.1 MAG: hypothetical protein AVO38_13625 [delta proteobacterium ML8_D]